MTVIGLGFPYAHPTPDVALAGTPEIPFGTGGGSAPTKILFEIRKRQLLHLKSKENLRACRHAFPLMASAKAYAIPQPRDHASAARSTIMGSNR